MKTMLTSELRSKLVQLAVEARERAYAPYSNYWVGAALITRSGKFFSGCNVESAAYPTSMCAERVAIFKSVSEGEREFVAMAVVTENGGTPCGACRQVMAEFGLDTVVLIADIQGKLRQEATVSELLPGAFGPGDLGK
jgi:cytidine deaminase